MNVIGWGIALVVLGLLLTFTNVFGFVAGVPLLWLGLLLVGVGIVLGIVHFVTGGARRDRLATRRGPLV